MQATVHEGSGNVVAQPWALIWGEVNTSEREIKMMRPICRRQEMSAPRERRYFKAAAAARTFGEICIWQLVKSGSDLIISKEQNSTPVSVLAQNKNEAHG